MGRKRVIPLASLEETLRFGCALGKTIKPDTILALSGDLGAGKTSLVQGLAHGLSISDPIQSPTFVYLNIYEGSLPLYHFDLYRLSKSSDFVGLGFDEYLEAGGICAIEWPERIETLLPPTTIWIYLSHIEGGRNLEISSLEENLIEWPYILWP